MRNAIFTILAAGALLAAWQAQDRDAPQPFAATPAAADAQISDADQGLHLNNGQFIVFQKVQFQSVIELMNLNERRLEIGQGSSFEPSDFFINGQKRTADHENRNSDGNKNREGQSNL